MFASHGWCIRPTLPHSSPRSGSCNSRGTKNGRLVRTPPRRKRISLRQPSSHNRGDWLPVCCAAALAGGAPTHSVGRRTNGACPLARSLTIQTPVRPRYTCRRSPRPTPRAGATVGLSNSAVQRKRVRANPRPSSSLFSRLLRATPAPQRPQSYDFCDRRNTHNSKHFD